MPNDNALLRQYSRSRDPEAFAALVRRHAGMVYGVCLRVTGNAHDAEDVAQECFLELARKARSIVSSLPGWLQTVATRRSLDFIREASTCRRYEEAPMSSKPDANEPTWREIAPHMDQALAELSEEIRAPVILHYLEDRSQEEIADELGVNQSTVSRRLEKGVAELRERLRKAGVVASAALLATLLGEQAEQAAPATLVASLGKMAIAGIGKAGAAGATAKAAAAGLGALKAKMVIGAVAATLCVGAVAVYTASTKREAPSDADRMAASPKSREVADTTASTGTQREPQIPEPVSPPPRATELDNLLAEFAFPFKNSIERRDAVHKLAERAGDRAPEVLVRAWEVGLARAQVTKELAKLRGAEAVEAMRRILVESAKDLSALNQTFMVHEAAKCLWGNDDPTGLHALVFALQNGWAWLPTWNILEEATAGAVRPPASMGPKRPSRWEHKRLLTLLSEKASTLQTAEAWWAERRKEFLRPISKEIERLRAEATTLNEFNPWPRRRAVVALYVLGAETSEEWLVSLLRERDGFLQDFAAERLTERGLWGFRDQTIETIRTSGDAEARARAVTTICAVLRHTGSVEPLENRRQPEALAALLAALDDPDPTVARLAAFAVPPRRLPVSSTPPRRRTMSRSYYGFNWLNTDYYGLEAHRAVVLDLKTGRDEAVEIHTQGENEWKLARLQGHRRALRRTRHSDVIAKAADILLDLAEEPPERKVAFLRRCINSPLRERVHYFDFGSDNPVGKQMRRIKFVDTVRRFSCSRDWHLLTENELHALLWFLANERGRIDPTWGMAIGRLTDRRDSGFLLEVIRSSKLRPDRTIAAGLALAMVGDTRAVPRLRAIASEPKHDKATRKWAALALAGLGDWENLSEIQSLLEWRRSSPKRSAAPTRPSRPGRRADVAHVSVRVPARSPYDAPRPPMAELPRLEPDLAPDEARVELERWWEDRRAWGGPDVF